LTAGDEDRRDIVHVAPDLFRKGHADFLVAAGAFNREATSSSRS
jgi:hypothetical protein